MLNLRQTRELIGISQQRLADAARVNVNAIADIEQGRTRKPAHELVVRVVRGLRRLGLTNITAEVIEEFYVPEDDSRPAAEEVSA